MTVASITANLIHAPPAVILAPLSLHLEFFLLVDHLPFLLTEHDLLWRRICGCLEVRLGESQSRCGHLESW